MTPYIDAAYRKIFGTVVMRGPEPSFAFSDQAPNSDSPVRRECLKVKLVIMSRATERELMREDYANATGICWRYDRTQPRTIFGVRVAFDDSLPDGEFLVSGELY